MSTKIEWATESWNPITGCTKCSPGCKNCYAERMAQRLAGRFGYPADEPFRVTLHEDRLGKPLRWRKPREIFVCSMGDLFHEDVPFKFVDEVFGVIAVADWHTFLVLTKRPGRAAAWFADIEGRQPGLGPFGICTGRAYLALGGVRKKHNVRFPTCGSWPLPNVAIGVTIEDQQRANERIPAVLRIPARWHFVSYEPALGPIDFGRSIPCGYYCDEEVGHVDHGFWTPGINSGIDAIIAGCESGPRRRPADLDWFRRCRDQCEAAGAAFFLKQAVVNGQLVKMPALDGRVHDELPWRQR